VIDEDSLQPPAVVAASAASDKVRWIFCGDQGLRAGWKALLFVAVVVALFLATRPLMQWIAPRSPTGLISQYTDFIRELWVVLLALCATVVMARLERRPLRSYGFIDGAGLRRLCWGAGWGFLSISVFVVVLWLQGSLVFDGLPSGRHHPLADAAVAALIALLVGLAEESLARGYLQFVLARALGFWWSAVVLSLIFGVLHGGNDGETWLGLLGAGTAGLFVCLSLWYTRSLFWAVGFHSALDWGESYFYGTPDSGEVVPWRLIATHPTGDPLWSGGSAGPEGSLLFVPLLVVLLVGMAAWWGRGKPALGLTPRYAPTSALSPTAASLQSKSTT
jgi:membrane protease YdiL (CAAX protease family)